MYKSKFKFYVVIWVALVALFNIIVFVTPNEIAGISKFSGSFWVGYIFTTLFFVGNLAVTWFSIKDDNIVKTFYNLPLLRISYISIIVMVIVGMICMAVPVIPAWISIIVCFIVLTMNIVALMKAQSAASIVEDIDKKIKVKTFFIKSLTVDMETLMSKATSEEIAGEVKRVYESVRYSDPMSDDALSSIETQITLKASELAESVSDENLENVRKIAKEMDILLAERNKKCKLLK